MPTKPTGEKCEPKKKSAIANTGGGDALPASEVSLSRKIRRAAIVVVVKPASAVRSSAQED